jgi:tetratricopeptide (TPR) repeat protein
MASDPSKVQALDNPRLCFAFLYLAFNNLPNVPPGNVNKEVARRNLTCVGDIAMYPMMSFFNDIKYKSITPEISSSIMDDLKHGRTNLDCDNLCALSFINKQSDLYALDMAENWKDLAIAVARIGHGEDLAYYYLGQAAQGLGYHEAAIKYYAQAAAIATDHAKNKLQCAAEGDIGQQVIPPVLLSMPPGPEGGCSGVDIPSVVPVLIQASRTAMAKHR